MPTETAEKEEATGIDLPDVRRGYRPVTITYFNDEYTVNYRIFGYNQIFFDNYARWVANKNAKHAIAMLVEIVESWDFKMADRKHIVDFKDEKEMERVPLDWIEGVVQAILDDRRGNIKNGAAG